MVSAGMGEGMGEGWGRVGGKGEKTEGNHVQRLIGARVQWKTDEGGLTDDNHRQQGDRGPLKHDGTWQIRGLEKTERGVRVKRREEGKENRGGVGKAERGG